MKILIEKEDSMPATKQQIRKFIVDNNLNSVAYVYSLLKGIYYELTLYMDLWNNEILAHGNGD